MSKRHPLDFEASRYPSTGVIYDSGTGERRTFWSRARTWMRFFLVAWTLLCLTAIWSNILAFNFVMVCLKSEADGDDDVSHVSKGQVPVFTPEQKTYLTSAVAVSALISNFAILPILTFMGVRTIFTVCGGISVIATAFMPLGIRTGFYAVLVLRCFQGVAFSASFPVIGAVASRWAYYKQYGFVVSMMVAYVQLSPTISMPTSGALCESDLGWPAVFYGHAIVSAFLFLIFMLIYRNTPSKHPLVTVIESDKIAINKAVQSKAASKKVPYLAILKTPAVWAVWVGSLGNFIFVNMIFLYSPSYFHNTLGMDVAESGLSAAVPAGLEFLLKILAGIVSDKVRCFNETNRLRFYNTLAYFGAAGVLAVLCFVPSSPENQTICFLLVSVATALLGFTTGGFFKAGPMVAKQYSQFVTGNVSLGLTLTMIIVPFIKNGIAPNDAPENWQKIFWFMIGTLVLTNIIFCVFCSAEPASWTKEPVVISSDRHRIAPISGPPVSTIPRYSQSTYIP